MLTDNESGFSPPRTSPTVVFSSRVSSLRCARADESRVSSAFQCEICSRRFSVQSNLNRHAKRCRARFQGENPADSPAAAGSAGTDENESASSSAASSATTSDAASPSAESTTSRGRKRVADKDIANSDASAAAAATPCSAAASPPSSAATGPVISASVSESASTTAAQPKRKRRRRAPSPLAWIPDSLRAFDLTPYAKSTPIPLPPVQPFSDTQNHMWEERDSFDDAVSPTPYHPCGWNGRLPGPALLGAERAAGGLAGCSVLVLG